MSTPPARSQKLPLPSDRDLTPGGYMRACRKRAGLTRKEVAERVAVQALARLDAQIEIGLLERNKPGDYSRLVMAIRNFAVFPFDFGTFVALAAETCSPELESFAA